MFSRIQRTNEWVDEFLVQMQKLAKVVDMTDDTMIRYAVLKGLKPHIRSYVLQQNAKTIVDALSCGRIVNKRCPATVHCSSISVKIATSLSSRQNLRSWPPPLNRCHSVQSKRLHKQSCHLRSVQDRVKLRACRTDASRPCSRLMDVFRDRQLVCGRHPDVQAQTEV